MAQALGIIDVVWKGLNLSPDTKTGSFDTGGLKNSPVVAGRKVHRSQEYKESMVEMTMPLLKGMSIADLFDNEEGELQVNCDTGQQFIIPDAFLTVTGNASAGDGGKVKLTWNGSAALEIV